MELRSSHARRARDGGSRETSLIRGQKSSLRPVGGATLISVGNFSRPSSKAGAMGALWGWQQLSDDAEICLAGNNTRRLGRGRGECKGDDAAIWRGMQMGG